jgi:hypothetical protein
MAKGKRQGVSEGQIIAQGKDSTLETASLLSLESNSTNYKKLEAILDLKFPELCRKA